VFNTNNDTTSFYITRYFLAPVVHVTVFQTTGIDFINTCLAVLTFVLLSILIAMLNQDFHLNNPNNKQP
jgi:hypothetical protein